MAPLSRGSIRLRPEWKAHCPWAALRGQQRCNSIGRFKATHPITAVASLDLTDYDSLSVAEFRDLAFLPEAPLLMQAGPMVVQSDKAMPAIRKWFDFVGDEPHNLNRSGKVMSAYLRSFASMAILPFELAYPQTHLLHGDTIRKFIESLRQEGSPTSTKERALATSAHDDVARSAAPRALAELLQSQLPTISETEDSERILGRPKPGTKEKILHFSAPLALLDAAIKHNLERHTEVRKLYVAQAPLNDLPMELRDDLPVPKLVKKAGRGDIYDSSIWLGLEPTYTPLHRDPNPNLFIQLCGEKIVRLLPPASGDQLFRDVQFRLGHSLHVNSRLRGPEMMDGPERNLMYRAVWHRDGLRHRQAPEGLVVEDQGLSRSKMQEARLKPGDALFIPKGWWHSVTSADDAGFLNASVNWWFR